VIPAILARAAAALARLEPHHWVALAGSAALHLGVLLGLSQAPPPSLPPPMTFEVKLEPPPAAKQARPRHAQAKATRTKHRVARKKSGKPQVREPHTLQAKWQGERKPAKDAPTVSLPNARDMGVNVATPIATAAATGGLAKAAKRPANSGEPAVDGGATSEPGGTAAGSASGSDPGITLAAAQGLGKSLVAKTSAGAQGSDALTGSAAATGNLVATSLSASAAGGSLNRVAGGGGHSAQASDFSSQSPGARADVDPSSVRLALAGVLSNQPALLAGNDSLTGGQFNGVAGTSAARSGQGNQATLATAASSGLPTVVNAAGPTQAGGGETSTAGEHGAAARGGSDLANLARAATAGVVPSGKPGSGGGARDGGNLATGALDSAIPPPRSSNSALARSSGGDSTGQAPRPRTSHSGGADPSGSGGIPRSLPGAGYAGGTARLVARADLSAGLPGQATVGAGLASGRTASAALAPGEPGSTPRLALAMHAVPAILEMRPGGARSAFHSSAGIDDGGAERTVATTLAVAGKGDGAPLQGRVAASSLLSTPTRLASLGGGGARSDGAGKLQLVKVAAVREMRADSQVQPLDVLAPATYCPLPGHVQPNNRPRVTTQDITEKPAYASDNPSFAFPLRAWAYGHEGRVTVRVQVMADGAPGQMWIKQSSGSGILDVDAREQLAKYRFKPARKNGQPVTAWIDVPVDYRLNAAKSP